MSIKKKHFSKRAKLVAGLSGVALVAFAFAGASSAIFTDSGNTAAYVQTGKLDFSVTPKVEGQQLEPGGSKSAPFVLDNSKSTVKASVAITAVTPVSVNAPNGADLSDGKLTVEIQDANGNVVAGPIAANAIAPTDLNLTLDKGQVWSGKVVYKLAADAGNEYQTTAVHYGSITFTATQVLPGS